MRSILLLSLLLPYSLFSQLSRASRVTLHVDKNICYPGDTVWFSSYSYKDKETNLYVDLYADDSILVSQAVFPVLNNKSFGSIVMPKQSGYYWLRSYTYNSQVFIMPLSVIDDSKVIVSRHLKAPAITQIQTPKVRITKEQDSLSIAIEDSFPCPLSLSVRDPRIPGPSYTLLPSTANFENPEVDYLSYSGTVKMNNRKQKLVRDKDIIFLFQQDSATKMLAVPVDSTGAFKITGLSFYDTAALHYQLNATNDGKISDIVISFQPKQFPLFTIPADYSTDTTTYAPKMIIPDFTNKVGYLKTVVVKTRWADRNKALDHRYVKDLKFTWPARFTFNVMDTNETKYTYDLFDFLKREVPGGLGRCKYYLDEVEIDSEFLRMMDVKTEIAYVKVIDDADYDSHGNPIRMVAVYRRKGEDLRSVPGKLGRMPILGYSTPAPFTQPDRITTLWIPNQTGSSFKIKKCTGRLVIEGVNSKGNLIHYETIIE